MQAKNTLTAPKVAVPIKLDLGCGRNKRAGFLGVDIRKFDGVDFVLNLGNDPWPWEDESVGEVVSTHFLEHLEPKERCHFVNELYRVLVPGAQALIVTPFWCSNRAYGDLTHKWPPVSEMWYFYLNKKWRDDNAPHNDQLYTCDFDFAVVYGMHNELMVKSQEYQQHALAWFKEAAQDLHATLTKRVEQKEP